MEILTTPIVEGRRICEYKGLVMAKNVRAVNIIRDFFTGFRDFFGGRSGSYQQVIDDMQREVLKEIADEAECLGAKNKSLIMAVAKGTAVVLE